MTIQRQYSLPNCRLVLEGWGKDPEGSSDFLEGRPMMTILVNAECHIVGQDHPLSGGREFLEELVARVSQYAQQVLSGVPHVTVQANGKRPMVQLQKTENSLHRLTVYGADGKEDGAPADASTETQVDLSTVQLFDLVEAIDQLVADAQTLPDIYLDLTPVPRRRTTSEEPLANRALPAALGISGLAIAAVALFYVPTPEFRLTDPEAQTTEDTIEGTSTDATIPGSDPEGTSDSDGDGDGDLETDDSGANAPDARESEVSSEVNGSVENDESLGEERSPATSVDDLPSQDEIEDLLTQATPIADGDQLDALTAQLRDQIVDAWDQNTSFEEDLEYRVGVSEDGDIVGFKFVNDAALNYLEEVPLLNLTNIPIDPEAIALEPIGQFKVVFRPNGVVEVSPWYGRPQSDEE